MCHLHKQDPITPATYTIKESKTIESMIHRILHSFEVDERTSIDIQMMDFMVQQHKLCMLNENEL